MTTRDTRFHDQRIAGIKRRSRAAELADEADALYQQATTLRADGHDDAEILRRADVAARISVALSKGSR